MALIEPQTYGDIVLRTQIKLLQRAGVDSTMLDNRRAVHQTAKTLVDAVGGIEADVDLTQADAELALLKRFNQFRSYG